MVLWNFKAQTQTSIEVDGIRTGAQEHQSWRKITVVTRTARLPMGKVVKIWPRDKGTLRLRESSLSERALLKNERKNENKLRNFKLHGPLKKTKNKSGCHKSNLLVSFSSFFFSFCIPHRDLTTKLLVYWKSEEHFKSLTHAVIIFLGLFVGVFVT